MQFNSYLFIFAFLPVALAGYYSLARLCGPTTVLGWLLFVSIVFYGYASLTSLALIIPSILIDYLIATSLLRLGHDKERQRAALFVLGITLNIAFLGYFKYKNFFLDTTNTILGTNFELAPLLLPIGISFITFQKIAFLADVRSGQVAEVRLRDLLLFCLFFPRVIAGPIVRYGEIIPQVIDNKPRDTMNDLAVGLCLFSIGLFKKAVVADGVARFVPLAFGPSINSDQPPAMLHAWAGVLSYTFQLYFDFSGYSDMALGVARMFGVRLPMNFNSPFKATSIVEFWNRWHITLTRFLTAYIYTPIVLSLTRSRLTKGKPILRGKHSTIEAIVMLVSFPTLLTMTISGLWHGAGWQFVLWGLIHGAYLTINQSWRIFRPRFWTNQLSYERVMRPVGFVLTFSAVVVALVFFRAPSLRDALSILGGMAGQNGFLHQHLELLEQLQVDVPWQMLKAYQSFQPFIYILILFFCVTLLPNSLEFMRRFQPALDFTEPVDSLGSKFGVSSVLERFRALRFEASFNNLTAMITGLLCLLGILALGRTAVFVYGQF